MKPVQKFNAIDQETIDLCINDYNSRDVYDTATMNKADPGSIIDVLKPKIEDCLGMKLKYAGGNYYKHKEPYLPHTDYKKHLDNKLNIVIPLSYTNSIPSLVIFDQCWELDSVTWCMHLPVHYFTYNTGVKGYPSEYPIKGSTGQDIDDTLYHKYLDHYPKNTLFGLSGSAFPFTIGSVIAFDNRLIHCTSKLDGEKLGITLRFK